MLTLLYIKIFVLSLYLQLSDNILSYKLIFSTLWMVVILYIILQTDLLNIMDNCDNVVSSLNWIQIKFKINILIYHEFKTTKKFYEGSQIKFNHL